MQVRVNWMSTNARQKPQRGWKQQNMEIVEVKTLEDIQKTAELADAVWHECYAELLSLQQIEYMVDKFQSPQEIEKQIKEQSYHYYLVKNENRAVAYMGVQVQDRQLYLSKIYILKEYRGQGLAQSLMNKANSLGAMYACISIWLTVNKGNERAIAAYEKEGFQRIREQCVDIGAGFVMDDYVYEKTLVKS